MPKEFIANVPNLDCMIDGELDAIALKYAGGANRRDFFPNGGRGTHHVTSRLAAYAGNKAVAMRARERGDIGSALIMEERCDKIYDELPDWAVW